MLIRAIEEQGHLVSDCIQELRGSEMVAHISKKTKMVHNATHHSPEMDQTKVIEN